MDLRKPPKIADVMDRIFELLLNKYNSLLKDLQIGYSIEDCKIAEMMYLLHVLHFVSFDETSNEALIKILAYYE